MESGDTALSGPFEAQKNCNVQHLGDVPNEDWDIDSLQRYARDRYAEIESDEKSLAVTYWRLGVALNLARRQFNHGQWTGFLNSVGIETTRASRARAIQRSFASEEALQGLSMIEAYRRRERKSRKAPSVKKRRESSTDSVCLREWLLDVCKKADFFRDEMSHANANDAANLLPVIDSALEELANLRQQVKVRFESQS